MRFITPTRCIISLQRENPGGFLARSQLLFSSLVVSSILVGCTPSAQKNSLNTLEATGIIGGEEVDSLDRLPNSVVAVYDSVEGQLCTGTLINKNVVLTAAHCIGQDINKMYIFFGKNLQVDGVYVQVDKAEISPYWNSSTDKDMGDLALLHFQGPLPASYKPTLMLPTTMADVLQNGTEVTVVGYGVTSAESKEASAALRKTTVNIADAKFADSELLVDQSSGQGVCHGDSGGPAFIEIDGIFYLWGVTSRGVNDASRTCKTTAAFTSIPYYRSWINRMNAKLSSSLINFIWRGQSQ